jgi:hypothetical protein
MSTKTHIVVVEMLQTIKFDVTGSAAGGPQLARLRALNDLACRFIRCNGPLKGQ